MTDSRWKYKAINNSLEFASGFANKKTRRAYLSNIQHWICFYPTSVEQRTQEEAEGYLEPYSARSRNLKITVLRKYHNLYYPSSRNPFESFRPMATKDDISIAPDRDVCQHVIDLAWEHSLRYFLIVSLLLRSGLRAGELLSIKARDFCPQQQGINIEGKGGKEAFVPLPGDIAGLIEAYITEDRKSGNEYLFTSNSRCPAHKGHQLSYDGLRHIIRSLLRLAGLDSDYFTAHMLRHRFALDSYERTGNLEVTQYLLRHSSADMANYYVRKQNTPAIAQGVRDFVSNSFYS